MKIALIILFAIVVGTIILFSILGVTSRSGEPLGLIEGTLSKCSEKPNCVCSEFKADTQHYIAPINTAQNTPVDSLPILKNIIQEMGGTIQVEGDDYLAATFSSTVFGFVDDLEVRIDSVQNIGHIRSASRVGHSDGGVNLKRVQLLKQLYQKRILRLTNKSIQLK